MNQLILKQMGLPDEEDTILGTQLNCNDKAIEYAVTGLLNNDHQLEEEIGKYAGNRSQPSRLNFTRQKKGTDLKGQPPTTNPAASPQRQLDQCFDKTHGQKVQASFFL